MKLAIFLLTTSLLATPALAAEHVVDSAFNVTTNLVPETGWSYGTGVGIAAGATGKRFYKLDPSIHAGDKLRYQITISSYAGTGSLQVGAGGPIHPSSGTNILAAGPQGGVAIPDNFDTNLGLTAGEIHTADDSTEEAGAFRFSCSGAMKHLPDDPMVFPKAPGASHLHGVVGNTAFNANLTTNRQLRTTGGSNCGPSRYPINRSAYWTPDVLNGQGAVVDPYFQNFYYKRLPAGNPVCTAFPDATHVGKCVPIPNQLRYLSGYNMATMSGGPTSADPVEASNFAYECRQHANPGIRNTTANGSYKTIKQVVDAGCPAGEILYSAFNGQPCWDGTHLDTADHRSHMAWAGTGTHFNGIVVNWTILGVPQTPTLYSSCPITHPYVVPTFAWQRFYVTDVSFAAGKWRLSSDEMMPTEVEAGTTLHMDYWEGWSPVFKALWETHCLDEHRTCSGGTDGVSKSFNGTPGPQFARLSFRPLTRLGMSRPLRGNGTFTGEITAPAGGMIYLFSSDGLVANVDNWTMTDVTKVPKRTGTVHVTTH